MQDSPHFKALDMAIEWESDAELCELDVARLRVQIHAGGRGLSERFLLHARRLILHRRLAA